MHFTPFDFGTWGNSLVGYIAGRESKNLQVIICDKCGIIFTQ